MNARRSHALRTARTVALAVAIPAFFASSTMALGGRGGSYSVTGPPYHIENPPAPVTGGSPGSYSAPMTGGYGVMVSRPHRGPSGPARPAMGIFRHRFRSGYRNR
jgi:hypothetical protein